MNIIHQTSKYWSRGLTLVEVMVAAGIMTIVMLGSSALQSSLMNKTTGNADRAFATEKAIQMFEEMRAFVQANREDPLNNLNNFHDGSNSYNWILTTERKPINPAQPTGTQTGLSNPGDPLSGNVLVQATPPKWKYVRQILVEPVPHDANARHVTVNIWHADTSTQNNKPKYATTPLASISGILKTNVGQAPPTQVYDVYLLALENMPGWWSDLASLRPLFDQMLNDLENRNPGLQYRRHYITRLGYGRDPYYLPYMNSTSDTASQDLPWSYFYAGKITPTNTSSATESYVASLVTGRVRNDSTTVTTPNDKTNAQYRPYALADQNNHTMRYPEEKAMYARLNAAKDTPDEPSLLTFLEEMNTNPNRFRHAIIINLHGELLPLPPYRNYSDAAKIPDHDSMSTARLITHPEKLQYANDSVVNLRVYPHKMVDATGTIGAVHPPASPLPSANIIPATSVFIPTDGAGTSPTTGSENAGFLDNPNFTPTMASASPAIYPKRIVGSGVKAYKTLDYAVVNDQLPYSPTAAMTTHSTSGNLAAATQLTFTASTAGAFTAGDRITFNCSGTIYHTWATVVNNPVNTISITGSLSNTCRGIPVYKRQDHISESNTAIAPINEAIVANTNQLRFLRIDANDFEPGQMLIIPSSGYTSRTDPNPATPLWYGWVTVKPTQNASNGYVQVYPPLPAIATNTMVFKKKDFEISTTQTVFGQAKNGIHIILYGSPTRHDLHSASNTGLSDSAQLYQTQYIPAPVASVSPNPPSSEPEFGKNLTYVSSSEAKNTARWIIPINTNAFGFGFDNQKMTIETRMVPFPLPTGWTAANFKDKVLEQGMNGDGDTHRPEDTATTTTAENNTVRRDNLYNVSRTYVYMGSKSVPITEKYQFLGDPRYTPYADVKTAHGYNWYFYKNTCSTNNTQFASGTGLNASGSCGSGEIGYANYNRKQAPSWDLDDADMNRYFALYSTGIMTSNSVYTSISGYSNYYYGLGGELGTDSSNVQFNLRQQPWSASDTGTTIQSSGSSAVAEIIGGTRLVMRTTADSWYARPWLGELFPSNEANFWEENGNLPTLDYSSSHKLGATNNVNTYYRGDYAQARVSSKQTNNGIYLSPRQKRLSSGGCGSFMNGNALGSGNNRFDHFPNDTGIGALTQNNGEAGRNLVDAFNLALNPAPGSSRPFNIDNTNATPPGYTETEIASARNKLQLIDIATGTATSTINDYSTYYRQNGQNSQISSAVVKMTRNSDANLVGYMLVNGLAKQGDSGANTLARFSQAGSLQAYMDGGDFSAPGDAPGRIVPLPRVAITYPPPTLVQENPTGITLTFTTDWKRWDNKKYSPAYPTVWYDTTPLVFNALYSSDNGLTWTYLNNPTATVPAGKLGQYNATYDLVGTKTVTALSSYSVNWNVTDTSFDGNYLVRVEAYRQSIPDNGLAYHQSQITIKR